MFLLNRGEKEGGKVLDIFTVMFICHINRTILLKLILLRQINLLGTKAALVSLFSMASVDRGSILESLEKLVTAVPSVALFAFVLSSPLFRRDMPGICFC